MGNIRAIWEWVKGDLGVGVISVGNKGDLGMGNIREQQTCL